MFTPLNSRDWARTAGLALLAAALWILFHDGWNAAAWQVPAASRPVESYTGDELELLARMKAAQERGWAFVFDSANPRLGAPWTADWSVYSMPDMLFTVAAGKLAGAIGLIPAANSLLLLAHVLAVVAFYAGSRALGHRPAFAAAAALLFGFSYFNFKRSLVYFSFTLSFVVPLILLVAYLVGGSRVFFQRRSWWRACAFIALWLGTANPYYGFLFAQLLALALLYRWFTRPAGTDHIPHGVALLGIFFVSLVASNWNAIAATWSGASSPLARNYASTEIYSLRFAELFIPPPSHRWAAAASLGESYGAASTLQGELFSPYLGFVGLAGLVLVAGQGVSQLFHRRLGLRPGYLPFIAWILLYGCTGGLNALFALTVTPLFRGTNRYSVAILALALLALAGWATRHARRMPLAVALGLAALVVVFGLWDQMPFRNLKREADVRAKIESDRQLGAALETGLPPNSAVFQLPAVSFLEQPIIHQMLDYELFRPYLVTHTMRFSYGLLTGDARVRWQQNVSRLPTDRLVATLQSAGFAALYLNRKACPDGGEALCHQFEAAGLSRLFAAGDHVVYRLRPSAKPLMPPKDDPLMFAAWNEPAPAATDSLAVLTGDGWFSLEHDGARTWRWASDHAEILLHNPSPDVVEVELTCRVTALHACDVSIASNGHELWLGLVSPRPPTPLVLRLRVPHGITRLVWSSPEPAQRPPGGDPRKLGFCVSDLRTSVR